MKEWCKLFKVGNRQILFYWEFDSIEDEYVIHQIYKTKDGLQVDMKLCGSDEDWVESAFKKLISKQENAEKVVKLIEKQILG